MMIISVQNECSFHNWYRSFERFSVHAILEEIPEEVVKYLLEDVVVLPEEATFENSDVTNSVDNDLKEKSIVWNSNLEIDNEIKPPTFPEFSKKLQENINALGGSAFLKLNWSAPTDAAWITASKSLKCSNLEDIYLLLKSSEKITNDLRCLKVEPNEKSRPQAYLILKKWIDIYSGTEFRCFVAHHKLIGLTQRDSEFHGHLSHSKFDIIRDINAFFNVHLKDKFSLKNYIFDVVRSEQGDIILIDVGMFCYTRSKPYLFTWKELFELKYKAESSDNIDPEFRYIGSSVGIQPNFENHFGVPQQDLTMLANQYKGLSIIDIIQMEVKLQEEPQ